MTPISTPRSVIDVTLKDFLTPLMLLIVPLHWRLFIGFMAGDAL
jgi:hypothetical protein